MAWTYTTREIVAALHKVDADALQDAWSDWVEELISEHTGYATMGTTVTVSAEKHDGNGTPKLFVKRPPIASVTSLKIGSQTPTALSATSYRVYDHYVELANGAVTDIADAITGPGNVFPVGNQNVEITYVSGLETVPATVQMAASRMIAEIAKFNQRGGADSNTKYVPSQRSRGERGTQTISGLEATLQHIMNETLRKRVIPLG